MKRDTKSTKQAAAPESFDSSSATLVQELASFYFRGIQRVVDGQKGALRLAAQQHADALDLCKKTLQAAPVGPVSALLEVEEKAFSSLMDTQNSILDLVARQNAAAMDLFSQRAQGGFAAAAAFCKDSLERGLAAQKGILDFAAQQNKLVGNTLKKQSGIASTPVEAATESIQRGVDGLIETQKELLDIVAKPLSSAAKA